ncbi:hypothetical protein GEMRC1_003031 [Eukaryota sp. GEM-RC1]
MEEVSNGKTLSYSLESRIVLIKDSKSSSNSIPSSLYYNAYSDETLHVGYDICYAHPSLPEFVIHPDNLLIDDTWTVDSSTGLLAGSCTFFHKEYLKVCLSDTGMIYGVCHLKNPNDEHCSALREFVNHKVLTAGDDVFFPMCSSFQQTSFSSAIYDGRNTFSYFQMDLDQDMMFYIRKTVDFSDVHHLTRHEGHYITFNDGQCIREDSLDDINWINLRKFNFEFSFKEFKWVNQTRCSNYVNHRHFAFSMDFNENNSNIHYFYNLQKFLLYTEFFNDDVSSGFLYFDHNSVYPSSSHQGDLYHVGQSICSIDTGVSINSVDVSPSKFLKPSFLKIGFESEYLGEQTLSSGICSWYKSNNNYICLANSGYIFGYCFDFKRSKGRNDVIDCLDLIEFRNHRSIHLDDDVFSLNFHCPFIQLMEFNSLLTSSTGQHFYYNMDIINGFSSYNFSIESKIYRHLLKNDRHFVTYPNNDCYVYPETSQVAWIKSRRFHSLMTFKGSKIINEVPCEQYVFEGISLCFYQSFLIESCDGADCVVFSDHSQLPENAFKIPKYCDFRQKLHLE